MSIGRCVVLSGRRRTTSLNNCQNHIRFRHKGFALRCIKLFDFDSVDDNPAVAAMEEADSQDIIETEVLFDQDASYD